MRIEDKDKLPNGWVNTTVGNIYKIVGGGTPSTKIPDYWNGSIPWISSADISEKGKIKPKKWYLHQSNS